MANRWFNQYPYTLEKQVVNLYAKVEIGAAGAPTLVTSNQSKGFASITRSAAGTYDVVLQDAYYKLLHLGVVFDAGTAGPAAPDYSITDFDASNSAVSGKPATFTILTQNGGTDTDPDNGEVMYIHLTVGNSSAI